jgi:cytochrome c553
MKRVLIALALSAPLFAAAADEAAPAAAKDAFTQGDAAAGQAKAATCFACHGPGGNGAINPAWPKLAGQHSAYIVEQLNEFKSGQRKVAVMMGQAATLSDDDMHNLAAYFAAQKPVPGVASKDAVAVALPRRRRRTRPAGLRRLPRPHRRRQCRRSVSASGRAEYRLRRRRTERLQDRGTRRPGQGSDHGDDRRQAQRR